MQKINFGRLSSGIPAILKSIEEFATRKSFTLDNNNSYISNPYINPDQARYFKLNNAYLNLCANILADDVIMNTIDVVDKNNERIEEYYEIFDSKFKHQLRNAALDFFIYGYAAVEILENNRIVQIPANTIRYVTNGNGLYFAEQQVNGKKVMFKILGVNYPKEYNELSTVGIIGSSEESNFYTQPKWVALASSLAENILMEKSSVMNLENGNNLSGILAIRGDLPYTEEGQPTIEEELKREMAAAGDGIMSLILREDTTNPINIDFIKINKDNESALQEKYKNNVNALLSMFNIPDVRLGISEGSESINSQKSKTQFNIYSLSIEKQQVLFEFFLEDFLKELFNVEYKVNISTPVFIDIDESKIDNVIKLFQNGLITLQEAINNVREIPSITLNETETDDPELLQSRFSNTNTLMTPFDNTLDEADAEVIKSLEKNLEKIDFLAK